MHLCSTARLARAATPAPARRAAARAAPRAVLRRSRRCVAAAAEPADASAQEDSDPVPPGCSRYEITLSKPLGLVLEEDKKTKSIRVAEIVPGSSAARTGLVTVGDTLVATSGYVYTRESTYQDTVVKSGQQLVRLAVRGERFETVMAAIGSHPGHVPVTLELQKCK